MSSSFVRNVAVAALVVPLLSSSIITTDAAFLDIPASFAIRTSVSKPVRIHCSVLQQLWSVVKMPGRRKDLCGFAATARGAALHAHFCLFTVYIPSRFSCFLTLMILRHGSPLE
jgi:hypothetical protein